MQESAEQQLDTKAPSRQLVRTLRTQPDRMVEVEGVLPESVLWRTFCELRRRGEPDVERIFVDSLQRLHKRRCTRGTELPTVDSDPDEHKLTPDPFLADLWKAYKRCICSQRTGPATQLLRDIEAQIVKH